MPRHYRGMGAKRPINSVKNIIDGTFPAVAAAVVTNVSLGLAVNTYSGAITDIPVGATVSSIYLHVEIIPDAAFGVADWFVIKTAAGIVPPVPGATGGTTQRKFILHEEKGIPTDAAAGGSPKSTTIVLKIPPRMRRFAEGDQLTLVLRNSAIYSACVKCIYKFYR